MKKYFAYELKKNIFIIGALTLAATVLYISPIFLFLPNAGKPSASGTYLWIISAIGGLIAAFVPVWIFGYKMKKRSIDLYYSLPLSHTKMLAVKFLIGLLAVFIPYTAAYWLGAFAVMAKSLGLNAVYYIPQYFASLIPVYFIYSIAAFVFTRANSVWDGLAFMLLWMFAVPMVVSVFEHLTEYYQLTFLYSRHYYAFAPLDFVTGHFQQHLADYQNIHPKTHETAELVNIILGFTVTALMSAGATVGLILFERRAKAENAGQISESLFGYKTLLPLVTVCLSGICYFWVLYILITVCSFFLTVAYKRTFKIGKKQAIIFAVSAVAGLILLLILWR